MANANEAMIQMHAVRSEWSPGQLQRLFDALRVERTESGSELTAVLLAAGVDLLPSP